ncbi:LuxR C-terminal-related transcriptional regulator [Gramella jeungdoensis]|uniref:LuxR C-terminal-related transcriptional regulator n=1 Tax=Gramella jeungdoensis TaxID=708091 RepID=A0ABT0Z494_9FLAO|nr:LuxR C-terminal-related transcriptional regulator [Gramella jeungdoensis]MCM8570532.1 LuxR C-terminal-related transcriptional regulator [Gramella jeungdoensis]
MEKRQLLIVSKNQEFIEKVVDRVSVYYEISVEKSIHVAYNIALTLLPDVILFDKTSFEKASDFKNLKTFKSTHFLTRSYLIVYGRQEDAKALNKRYKSIIDEFLSDNIGFDLLAERIQKSNHSGKINYWHECFMGLFNLMAKPIVLLQQNSIIAMNDAFKKTFRIEDTNGLRLTDLVNVENKAKVKTSLRNFARGKHMKAVTSTSLLVHENKLRNAKISFSKLSRNINDQFIMIIDFSGDQFTMDQNIGSHADQVEKCFKENSELAEFSFTKREKEIISLLCKGYKTKEISEALFISPKTIEKHRSNIIKRTNSETILESVIYAINHNLVDFPMS